MIRAFVVTLTTSIIISPSIHAQDGSNLAKDFDSVENGWHFDYAEAVELARQTNKPLMVVFRCVP